MTASSYDHVIKIVLSGNCGVGKSSLFNRYTTGECKPQYTSGIGKDFATRTTQVNGKKVKVHIWDTAGHERFGFTVTPRSYFRGAAGAMLVYNIANEASFDAVEQWLAEVRNYADQDLTVILVGNKNDLEDRRSVSIQDAKSYAESEKTTTVKWLRRKLTSFAMKPACKAFSTSSPTTELASAPLNRSPLFRIFSALVVAVCLGLTAYQVAERILYYIRNPVNTQTKEYIATTAIFPTIVVCNNRKIGLTTLIQKLQLNNDSLYLNDTAIDIVEILSTLRAADTGEMFYESNLDTYLDVLKNLRDYAISLREIAEITENSNDSPPSPVIDDPDMEEILKIIQDSVMIFPIKPLVWLMNTEDMSIHKYGEVHWKAKFDYQKILYESSWRLNEIRNEYILKSDEGRLCYYDWKCRLEMAAAIMEEIASYDLQRLANYSVQSASDLFVSCSWSRGSAKNCTFTESWTPDGLCYEVHPTGEGENHLLAARGETLQLVLNLEKYDTVPIHEIGYEATVGKIFMYPPKTSSFEPGGEKRFTVKAGNNWEIAINKIQQTHRFGSRCGKIKLSYFNEYAAWKCLWESESDLMNKECGCVPMGTAMEPVIQSFPEMRHCGISEELDCRESTLTYDGNCPLDCDYVGYGTDLSSTPLDLHFLKQVMRYSGNWESIKRERIVKYDQAVDKLSSGSIMNAEKQSLKDASNQAEYVFEKFILPLSQAYKECDKSNQDLIFKALNSQDDELLVRYYKEIVELATVLSSGLADIDKLQLEPSNFLSSGVHALQVGKDRSLILDIGTPELIQFQQTWLMMRTAYNRYSNSDLSSKISEAIDNIVQVFYNVPAATNLGNTSPEEAKQILNQEAQCLQNMNQILSLLNDFSSSVIIEELTTFFGGKWFVKLQDLMERLKKFQPGSVYDRENLAVVSIYFGQMENQTLTESLSYNGFGLLADIGGTLGLYLGATVFVFFEMMIYLVKLAKETLILKREEDPVEPKKEKDSQRKAAWMSDDAVEPPPVIYM